MMNVAILGAGNMGKALIGGLKRAYGAEVRLVAWDKEPEALAGLGGTAESGHPNDWASVGFVPDAVILAVKPNDIFGLIDDVLGPVIKEHSLSFLTVSIAAGISISSIRVREKLGSNARICRVMTNTPALIGEGMSAYTLSEGCGASDAALVEAIFKACGKVISVPEYQMDAVTGLSGSGPAFVYSFIEALAEGGVSAGLPYNTALDAAVQTVIGAAKMVQSTVEHPSVLRSRVMSPGGTTVRGLQALERGAFKGTVMSAVTEASARSAGLSAG